MKVVVVGVCHQRWGKRARVAATKEEMNSVDLYFLGGGVRKDFLGFFATVYFLSCFLSFVE